MSWRVGESYGIHVYAVGEDDDYREVGDDDRPVATFFRASDAEAAVAAYNDRGNSELIAELRAKLREADRVASAQRMRAEEEKANATRYADSINALQIRVNNQHAKIKALEKDGKLRAVLRGQQDEIRRADRILQAAGITVAITTEPFDDTEPTKETDD